MAAKDKEKGTEPRKEKVTMEIMEKKRRREMEFQSEEERLGWEKAYRKSKWYTPYFLVGVGINYLLYRAGLNLSQNILVGFIVGVGVPIVSMFGLTELHYHFFTQRR